jgi:hypothetical protein
MMIVSISFLPGVEPAGPVAPMSVLPGLEGREDQRIECGVLFPPSPDRLYAASNLLSVPESRSLFFSFGFCAANS